VPGRLLCQPAGPAPGAVRRGLLTAQVDELARIALTAARAAAAYIRAARPAGRVAAAQTKSSPTDPVTLIDQAAEKLIRESIGAERPHDGFLGEEGGGTAGSSGVVWVVDPIDGTVNFMYGIGAYAVSIGAEIDGTVEAGCIVNVVTGEEYTAVRGAGAFARTGDGAPARLAAHSPPSLSHALVGTGFNYVVDIRLHQARAVTALLAHVRDIRRNGSAALDLCAVAEGRLDAYVEQGLKPWDLAAGGLIARESGVRLAGLGADPDERLTIAAPEPIAEEFFRLVRTCGF